MVFLNFGSKCHFVARKTNFTADQVLTLLDLRVTL